MLESKIMSAKNFMILRVQECLELEYGASDSEEIDPDIVDYAKAIVETYLDSRFHEMIEEEILMCENAEDDYRRYIRHRRRNNPLIQF